MFYFNQCEEASIKKASLDENRLVDGSVVTKNIRIKDEIPRNCKILVFNCLIHQTTLSYLFISTLQIYALYKD